MGEGALVLFNANKIFFCVFPCASVAKNKRLKTFLIIGIALFLLACGKTVLAKKGDKYIWLVAHSSYPKTQPHWKKYEIKHKTYFGKYTYFNDHFNDYYGDPLGPIVAVWKVTRYLGKEPSFKDCGKEPIYPSLPSNMSLSSPEFTKLTESYSHSRKKYYSCLDDNDAIEDKSKTITYYYARSKNNYLPILPPRPENHGVYEIHVSFGPMGWVEASKGLNKAQLAKIDQLESEPCHRHGKDMTCYRLPGENSHLYYTVRSILKSGQGEQGKISSPWKRQKFIDDEVHPWEEIKGIEISQAQYEYMKTRCNNSFSCYLDDKAPDLTTEQQEYIKVTAWDIDTDESARNALIKKAEKYRHDK